MNPYSWHTAYAETADATYSTQRERQLKKKKIWEEQYNHYKVYYYGSRQDKEFKKYDVCACVCLVLLCVEVCLYN